MQALWPAMNVPESDEFAQKLMYGCERQWSPADECRMPFGPLTDADKAVSAAAMQPIQNW